MASKKELDEASLLLGVEVGEIVEGDVSDLGEDETRFIAAMRTILGFALEQYPQAWDGLIVGQRKKLLVDCRCSAQCGEVHEVFAWVDHCGEPGITNSGCLDN